MLFCFSAAFRARQGSHLLPRTSALGRVLSNMGDRGGFTHHFKVHVGTHQPHDDWQPQTCRRPSGVTVPEKRRANSLGP